MKRLLIIVTAIITAALIGSQSPAQASSNFGTANINCGMGEGAIAATGAARVNAGGSTIYMGYQQVSANNQNPIVASFGANTWCRNDIETSSDDGRAYGLWWDGSTLFGVFSATGTGSGGTNYSAWTGGGWLNSYGPGGGGRVSVILRLNPADGTPQGGTYVSARLESGNTNSATVNSISYTGSTLLLGIDSAFSPRNVDRTKMDCTNYPLTWTLELAANLGSAVGSAASNCVSTSPPPSQVIGAGGTILAGESFADGRLNARDLAAPVAIYCNAQGIEVYSVNPTTSQGIRAFLASPAQVRDGITTALREGRNITIISGDGATLYALRSNELQVNKFAFNGSLYEFIFPADACDSVFSSTSASSTTSTSTTTTTAPVSSFPNLTSGPQILHIVQPGENLFRIGLRYGIPYPELGNINGIDPPYQIFAGQTLIIPER